MERLTALAALAEVSLVKHDPFEDATPAVTVHRLVQAVTRARSEANGSAQGAVQRLIARLVAITHMRGTATHSRGRCARSSHHICWRGVAVMRLRSGNFWIGQAGISMGARLTLKPWAFSRCASDLKKALGESRYSNEPQQPRPACSRTRATITGARPLYERALATYEKALGPEHPLQQRASTTSPTCSGTRATLQGHGRSTSAR